MNWTWAFYLREYRDEIGRANWRGLGFRERVNLLVYFTRILLEKERGCVKSIIAFDDIPGNFASLFI